jgi:hypothetical protein
VGTGLRLGTEVCEALRAEAFAGLKALRRRGAEVGGLLTRRSAASPPSVIDGFELIPCEHLYGPSYRLSPNDIEAFRRKYREFQEKEGVAVAGFFRSSTKEVLEVTPEDAAVVQELFSGAAVIVLIRPSPNGDAIFRVFQPPQDGEWREFEEFRRGAHDVLIAARPATAPVIPARPGPVIASPAPVSKPAFAPAPVADRAPVPPEPLAWRPPLQADTALRPSLNKPRQRRFFAAHWMTLLLAVSLLVFASALIVATRGMWNAAPQTAQASSPDLGMQVAWQGDSLRLTWNRSLPSVRNSNGGNLEIHDGNQYREVPLDTTQVAQAVIYYVPGSDDVTFRLNIRGREPVELGGITRVLANRPNGVPAPVQEARSAPIRSPEHRPESFSNPAQANPAPPHVTPPPPQPSPSKAETSPPALTPGLPSQPAVSSTPPVPTNSEQQKTEEKKADVTEPRRPPETAPPAPAPPRTADAAQLRNQTVPAAPAAPPPSAEPKPPLTSGSFAAPKTDLPTPPRPVKRVLPVRQASLGPAVLTPMTVTVQVSIDKKGNVVEAHALHSASQYWSGRAVAAALQWHFEPATLHGQSIASTSEIDFRFNPR